MPFVDSDHEIEIRIGCSIREFFEREGEARFRDIEEEVLDTLTLGPAKVVSTEGEPRFTWSYRLYGGLYDGGAVLDYQTLDAS